MPRLVADFDAAQRALLEHAAISTVLECTTADWRSSQEGQRALSEVAVARFLDARHVLVPWVNDVRPLAGARILEIGCGSGSGTVAFAERARSIVGVDIDPSGLAMAHERQRIHGLKNIALRQTTPDGLLEQIAGLPGDTAPDVVLFFAVLEHMTVSERIAALRATWHRLAPGGLIVVFDTPNRLTWSDLHTSLLPFFHTLPPELALLYAARSDRAAFRDDMARPEGDRHDRLARWGTGVGFQEFVLALDCSPEELSTFTVNDGWNRRITDRKHIVLEEKLLMRYWEARRIAAPIAFARQSIDIIIEKPGSRSPAPRCQAPHQDTLHELRRFDA